MSSESGQAYRAIGARKGRSDNYLFTVLVAVVLGFAGAAGAIVFRILIRLFQGAFFGGAEGVTQVFEAGLFALAASISGVFFFFSTHMHENHFFMAVPLTLALAMRSRRWFWLFIGTTVAAFLNIVLHDLEVTLGPPFTWGGISPVENLHLHRPFAWGELVGTYLGTILVTLAVAGIYFESWNLLRRKTATD